MFTQFIYTTISFLIYNHCFQQEGISGLSDIQKLYSSQENPKSYSIVKKEIMVLRTHLKSKNLSKDSLSSILTNILINKIIPYWMGTKWSFEGHTSIPGSGTIACGYFVSTTLKDAGFNLDKYKLAQQSPKNEAKSLNAGNPLLEIIDPSTAGRIKTLKETLLEGIYFIGFDNSHVGFLYYKNLEMIIIHSNYIDGKGVVAELIQESEVFSYYDRIFIAEISTNRELLKKWTENKGIKIITE